LYGTDFMSVRGGGRAYCTYLRDGRTDASEEEEEEEEEEDWFEGAGGRTADTSSSRNTKDRSEGKEDWFVGRKN
jgi:hypothetical protein